ncbi:hypothetical protein J7L81_05140 [Candidatus Aerophobetes bacterium]|nr:hypothetical protein [Candidatus Aerophobetes bacterium]
MKPRFMRERLKRVGVAFSGPSSYSTGGFTHRVGALSKIARVLNVHVLGGGEYIAQVVSTSGNQVTIKVRDNIEQAVDEGGTATYTIGGEVADGTDLSSIEFVLEGEVYERLFYD